MRICVSCASGCEAVLKRELYKLGYGDLPAINGRIYFEGDIADVAKCNLFLQFRILYLLCNPQQLEEYLFEHLHG